MKEKTFTWFLFSSFLKANVRKAPAAALCTFGSSDSRSSTRGGIPPSILNKRKGVHMHKTVTSTLSKLYIRIMKHVGLPDKGFNGAILMSKISDSISSPTYKATNSPCMVAPPMPSQETHKKR